MLEKLFKNRFVTKGKGKIIVAIKEEKKNYQSERKVIKFITIKLSFKFTKYLVCAKSEREKSLSICFKMNLLHIGSSLTKFEFHFPIVERSAA